MPSKKAIRRENKRRKEHALTVRWTHSAAQDLVAIVRYIKRASPKAAAEFLALAQSKAADLTDFPRRGRVVPELERLGITEWREIIFKHYRLIYTVEIDSVEVDALIDARRDIEEFLLERLVRPPE